MRLIDADTVKKAINDEIEIAAEIGTHEADVCKGGLMMGLAYVNTAPTVDAVPVVRCKDCKHSQKDELWGMRWCKGTTVKDEHFCADGERKDDE